MPQFEQIQLFLPQIFWLLVCFAVLYFAASRIILPRIAAILTLREDKIDSNTKSAQELQLQIEEIQERSNKLREQSNLTYQKSIESTLKDCSLNREKSINKAKADMEKLSAKSDKKISDFIAKSKSEHESLAVDLADKIVKKLFGKGFKFQ